MQGVTANSLFYFIRILVDFSDKWLLSCDAHHVRVSVFGHFVSADRHVVFGTHDCCSDGVFIVLQTLEHNPNTYSAALHLVDQIVLLAARRAE